MSDVGTITEIEPEDQLGWIEMDNGDRVRFGGTACKGFVPEIGMKVKVLGTRPGYGGTTKATGLEKVADAAGNKGPAAVGAAAGVSSAPRPAPRKSLHLVQSAGIRADETLLKILGRWDMDDQLHQDLEALMFEVGPCPASELDCHNPWLHVIAMNGGGDAYGLYQHPVVAQFPQAPWVVWQHETDHVRYLAADTGTFFQGILAAGAQAGVDAATVARARQTLSTLGVPAEPGQPLAEQKMAWLPPEDDELRALDEYLGESDGAEMERGLLAYVSRKQEQRALQPLKSLYEAWGWNAPGL